MAYQCSRCEWLVDCGDNCRCLIGIDPRTNHRKKGNTELCRKNFEALSEEERWHEKFAWEN